MIDYLSLFRLDKKTALVCGGLGLLGKETSIALAQAGAKVLVLDIDSESGKALEKEYQEKGLDIKFIFFDISHLSDYKLILSKLDQEFGPIHIFINSAYPRTEDWGDKLEEIKLSSWQKNIDLQLNSACLLTKEVAEIMKKNKVSGSIINFGSIYGLVAPDFGVYTNTDLTCPAAYAAIKGGIINFSRYAASYYGQYGIRINCICPGGVFNNQDSSFVANYEKRTPLKRMGKPEEIAAAVLFLASNAASYITGTTFMVDGGWTCI